MNDPSQFRTADIIYDPETGLQARLYIPQGTPRGAIVDVHGGAWCVGDRSFNAAIASALAAAGILVMSIDFRKPPIAQYPASIADTHLAIRWLKAVAPAYGVPTNAVGGLGTSSGGHQLLLAYLGRDDPRYAATPLPPVLERGNAGAPVAVAAAPDAALAYMILCWPVADPHERYGMVRDNPARQDLIDFHHAYWPDEAAMREGNPQALLAAKANGDLPPALIIQGTRDANLPTGSADRLAQAYRAAGGTADLSMFDDAVHGFITRDPDTPDGRRALAMIVDFATRHSAGHTPR